MSTPTPRRSLAQIRAGRPALERFRFDLIVAIELGATDHDDADARIDALLDQLRPRLERMVRNTRTGAPVVVNVDATDPSIA